MSVQLLTADEVAERLHISRRAFFALRARGDFIKPVRVGPRTVRYRESDVAMWVETRMDVHDE